jgi:hypothetical protein
MLKKGGAMAETRKLYRSKTNRQQDGGEVPGRDAEVDTGALGGVW